MVNLYPMIGNAVLPSLELALPQKTLELARMAFSALRLGDSPAAGPSAVPLAGPDRTQTPRPTPSPRG